jgi:uroporphyrin-III C-methyltransferase
MSSNKTELGSVSFVSGGPGPVDLLTLRGKRAIESAEVILYDALLDSEFLDIFPKGCVAIFVGKRADEHSRTQTEINSLILEWAKKGKRVVRLKGGDASIFGRLAEEMESLEKEGIPFEVIPGVSSVNAGAASLKTSLTVRGKVRQIIILDGHTILEDDRAWQGMENFQGTIAILMGTKQVKALAEKLISKGLDQNTPVFLCENVGSKEMVYTESILAKAKSEGITKQTKGPGILFIGEVLDKTLISKRLSQNPIQSL